jgi:hypothetical protein
MVLKIIALVYEGPRIKIELTCEVVPGIGVSNNEGGREGFAEGIAVVFVRTWLYRQTFSG